jgi:hypothetical protein
MAEEIQKVKVIPQDVDTLVFNGVVAANSIVTLVSQRLMFPFATRELRAHFALNTNKQLRLQFVVSPDDSEPTSEPFTGHSLLSTLGQVPYIVGDDETVVVPYHVLFPEIGMYLKIFADNRDSYEHSIDAQIFITRDVDVEV